MTYAGLPFSFGLRDGRSCSNFLASTAYVYISLCIYTIHICKYTVLYDMPTCLYCTMLAFSAGNVMLASASAPGRQAASLRRQMPAGALHWGSTWRSRGG